MQNKQESFLPVQELEQETAPPPFFYPGIRICIDIGKTTSQFRAYIDGEALHDAEVYSTWVGGTYSDFVQFIGDNIRDLPQIQYVQISVPFPFDSRFQQISEIKETRPDFTPDKDIEVDLKRKYGIPEEAHIHILNDAEQKTRATAIKSGMESFIMIHSGSGVNITTYNYGDIQSHEIHEDPTMEEEFDALRGVNITKKIFEISRSTSDIPIQEAVRIAQQQPEWNEFQHEVHQKWIKYLTHVQSKLPHTHTIIVPERLLQNGLFPTQELQSNFGFALELITQQVLEKLSLTDTRYDQINWYRQPKRPFYLIDDSLEWAETIQSINYSSSSQSTKEALSYVTYLYEDIDLRYQHGQDLLYGLSRTVQRILHDDDPLAVEAKPRFQYPLPQAVRLNTQISNLQKFMVEHAHSLDIIDTLAAGTTIGVVIPIYNEVQRMLPPDHTNPLGEDFIVNKALQLEQLFSNSEGKYQLLFVDDGSSDETYQLAQSIIDRISFKLKKGTITIKRLNDMVQEDPPLKISDRLKSSNQSIKGGASLAGAEFLADTSDYILLSDADLESHLGSLGVLLEPHLKEPSLNMTVAYRQKLLSDVGRGFSRFLSYFKDKSIFADKFSYLMKRYAYCQLFLPHIQEYPDFQTGFKIINPRAFKQFFATTTNFADSYDLDLLEYALKHGAVKNIPITPVFISKEASKFTTEAKMSKFAYYEQLARQRNSKAQYLFKKAQMPIAYIRSVWNYLLKPSLTFPRQLRQHQDHFEI